MRYTSLTLLALGSSPLSSSTCWAQNNTKGGDAIVDSTSTGTGASLLSSLVGNKKNTNKNYTVISKNKNKKDKNLLPLDPMSGVVLTNRDEQDRHFYDDADVGVLAVSGKGQDDSEYNYHDESIESIETSADSDADVGVLAATSTAATTAFQGEEARRRLAIPGSSCTGTFPCNFRTSSGTYFVGTHSCNGDYACLNAGYATSYPASFRVADYSCNSYKACSAAGRNGIFIGGEFSCREGNSVCRIAGQYGYANIGDRSCTGEMACYRAGRDDGTFIAGEFSCIGSRVCSKAGEDGYAKIGKGSCNGNFVCYGAGYDNNATIGNGSCTGGSQACLNVAAYGGNVEIGDTSCIGVLACREAQGVIGSGSCRGTKSCYNLDNSTVGDCSCTCDNCCENLPTGSFIGDFQCTSLEDGCSNADPGTPLNKLGDYDATNELQSLDLLGTSLSISDGNQVDLAQLLQLGFTAGTTTLSISGGNAVDLAPLLEDATNELQNLALSGTSLSISDGNTIDLSNVIASILVDNDATNELQNLALSGTSLSISDGNQVDLASILVDNDATNELQSLGIDGTDLSITDGNQVDLAPLLQLGIANTTLSIVGGNQVDLAPLLEDAIPATVLTYQAFVDGISKDGTSFLGLVYTARTPIVINYGISGITGGWTLCEASRLVGMSITPNKMIEEGSVVVTVLITDPTGSLVDEDFGSLTIDANDGISKAETFDDPMTIDAGSRVSIKVERIGEVRPYNNDAGLILQFEQQRIQIRN